MPGALPEPAAPRGAGGGGRAALCGADRRHKVQDPASCLGRDGGRHHHIAGQCDGDSAHKLFGADDRHGRIHHHRSGGGHRGLNIEKRHHCRQCKGGLFERGLSHDRPGGCGSGHYRQPDPYPGRCHHQRREDRRERRHPAGRHRRCRVDFRLRESGGAGRGGHRRHAVWRGFRRRCGNDRHLCRRYLLCRRCGGQKAHQCGQRGDPARPDPEPYAGNGGDLRRPVHALYREL